MVEMFVMADTVLHDWVLRRQRLDVLIVLDAVERDAIAAAGSITGPWATICPLASSSSR